MLTCIRTACWMCASMWTNTVSSCRVAFRVTISSSAVRTLVNRKMLCEFLYIVWNTYVVILYTFRKQIWVELIPYGYNRVHNRTFKLSWIVLHYIFISLFKHKGYSILNNFPMYFNVHGQKFRVQKVPFLAFHAYDNQTFS